MPCRAIEKFSTRNGCMFRWAWLPPTFAMVVGFIAARPLEGVYVCDSGLARKFPVGIATFVLSDWGDALAECVWVGISLIESVCPCSPPLSPRVCALPMWIGA